MSTATLTTLRTQLHAVRAQADAALAVLGAQLRPDTMASDADALPPALHATLDRIRAATPSPGDTP